MANPQLGYGHQTEANINQVNQWLRSQPEWQQIKGRSNSLSSGQRQQIMRLAQSKGIVIDEGDMEIDPAGNINPVGHKLRNTLVVAGIAGAALATAGAAGAFAGGAGGGGAAASSAGAAATGAGGAGAAGAGMAGLSYGELLRNGLPFAGGLLNSIFQRKDQNSAFDASQKYLEEALAYQKEQDAYNRQRQERMDALDQSHYGDVQARSDARYGDSQQEYLADFERDEDRYGYKTDLEASRYGDYSKRIAPYLDSGTNANARMSQLLGLQAPAPFDRTLTTPPVRVRSTAPTLSSMFSGGGSSGPAASADPAVAAFISDWQKTHPVSEGIAPLAAAVAARFPHVSRFMYGQTPSDNELSINGRPYKVLGGENSPAAAWYVPGTYDGRR